MRCSLPGPTVGLGVGVGVGGSVAVAVGRGVCVVWRVRVGKTMVGVGVIVGLTRVGSAVDVGEDVGGAVAGTSVGVGISVGVGVGGSVVRGGGVGDRSRRGGSNRGRSNRGRSNRGGSISWQAWLFRSAGQNCQGQRNRRRRCDLAEPIHNPFTA